MLLINAENILKKRSYYSLKTLITVINRVLVIDLNYYLFIYAQNSLSFSSPEMKLSTLIILS